MIPKLFEMKEKTTLITGAAGFLGLKHAYALAELNSTLILTDIEEDKLFDVKKQVSTNRFKVTDGTLTGIVKLTDSLANAAGEGSVRLLDTDGGTYFATKLTARKAVITRGTGTQTAFVTGTSVKWNMTAATADSLLIDNA